MRIILHIKVGVYFKASFKLAYHADLRVMNKYWFSASIIDIKRNK
jgi:hypothetical protein